MVQKRKRPPPRPSRDGLWFILALIGMLTLLALLFIVPRAHARDDGRYANNPLKPWFDSLRSRRGSYCCSDADGKATEWDIRKAHYWVPINGVWTQVPDDAVIDGPNRAGKAMVWLTQDNHIRCFIPGSGA